MLSIIIGCSVLAICCAVIIKFCPDVLKTPEVFTGCR